MKNSFAKMFTVCALAWVFGAAFIGCGDDGSSSPKGTGLPAEVADKAELETYECSMDVIGEKVYVTELEENYECDGEKWFKSYDQTKPSSTSTKSSSSKKSDGSSDSKAADKDGSSSSATGGAASNHDTVDVKIVSSGTYDCSKYKCVTTEFLNQDLLKSGKYGEFLDERDGKVYKTIVIGVGERTQTWMAQNMNFSDSVVKSHCYDKLETNCEKYGALYIYENAKGACPAGWHLPSSGEYEILSENAGGHNGLKSQYEWEKSQLDRFGFSALPAGFYKESAYKDNGDETRLWTSSLHPKRDHWVQQCDTYRLSDVDMWSGIQSWFVDESYSVRCIKDVSEKNPADTIVIKGYEGSYGTLKDERDGKEYKTVKIGPREWMAENLDYDTLNASSTSYGGKYYTANQARAVCPQGWHLPYMSEWDSLVAYVDRNRENISIASALKSTDGWNYHPDIEPGRDVFGFSGTPSGYISGTFRSGELNGNGTSGWLWARDILGSRDAQYIFKLEDADSEYEGFVAYATQIPVRCIKNLHSDYEYGTLIDARDGKNYNTTKIGDQNWMAENLDYAYLESNEEKDSLSFCLQNEPDSCAKYGRLYAYETIMDSSVRLCPSGWHIPNYTEWNQLFSYIKDDIPQQAIFCPNGLMLRSEDGWKADENGLNFYGFSILPSGYLSQDYYINGVAYLAYASDSKYKAGYLNFNYNASRFLYEFPTATSRNFAAYGIRCVQDE